MTHVQTRHHSGPKAALIRIALCASALATCTLVTGCASEVPRYSPGIVVGDQGHSAEMVFESPTMLAMAPQGAQSTFWRDDSLNIRTLPTPFDRAAWPGAHRPSLDRLRRLNLKQQDESVWYFREEGYQYRGSRSRY